MTEDQVRLMNKLLERYNHPGARAAEKWVIANELWSRYGITVKHEPDARTSA